MITYIDIFNANTDYVIIEEEIQFWLKSNTKHLKNYI